MPIRIAIAALVLLVGVVSSPADEPRDNGGTPPGRRPNVVVVLADDQGWGDLSFNGNPNIQTPNIDAIARRGMIGDAFYVCPVCAPTRAEFLTGRYHPRGGVSGVSSGAERMSGDEITLAEILRDNGYATAAFGKWHNGSQWPSHPNAQGFDEYYGFTSGHWGNYFAPMLQHNGETVRGVGYLPDDLTDHAVDFISEHRDEPFFVYVAYNTPHSPMQVPDTYWDEVDPDTIRPDPRPDNAKQERRDFTRAALAMAINLDDNVGRLTAAIDDAGLTDDTIVVYFSDNGPNSARFNGGMRGRKGSLFEGGVRSPLAIAYPGAIPPGTRSGAVIGAVDLTPTLLDWVGLADSLPDDRPIDGRSFADTAAGGEPPIDDTPRDLVAHWNDRLSVRRRGFRYHESGELYDLDADPGETTDVSAEYPGITESMAASLTAYRRDVRPRRRGSTDPFVVGYPGSNLTQLPARDATASGAIRRNNRYPNCTFFTDWTDPFDSIRWDVDVAEAGTYAAELFYAASPKQIGATLHLSDGRDGATHATMRRPNDAPLRGASDDRITRMEGYVKDWATMSLGRIDLVGGEAVLKLTASDIPPAGVGEVRMLVLRRVDD